MFNGRPFTRLRVLVATKGLTHPWGLACLPNAPMRDLRAPTTRTDHPSCLRIIRDGVFDREPIRGVPDVVEASSGGLRGTAQRGEFVTNRFVT